MNSSLTYSERRDDLEIFVSACSWILRFMVTLLIEM